MFKRNVVVGVVLFLSVFMFSSLSWAEERITPARAKEFRDIEKLAPVKISDREFWFLHKIFLEEDKTTGLDKEPFLRESGVNFVIYSPGPQSMPPTGVCNKLALSGNKAPVVYYIHGNRKTGYFEEQKELWRLEEAKKFVEELGPRFIGLVHLETVWDLAKSGHVKTYPAMVGLPMPETKEEAYQAIRKYFCKYVKLDDIPIAPGLIGYADHHTLRWGASATTAYFGSGQIYGQLQSAFARGAARQFKRPWHIYYAVCGVAPLVRWTRLPAEDKKKIAMDVSKDGNPRFDYMIDGNLRFDCRSPEIVRVAPTGYIGPRMGADPQTFLRPSWYYCYMTGVNSLQNESDAVHFRYAGYDPKADPEPPLVRILRDGKLWPSPAAYVFKEIHAYMKRQPRGIPYTPVAILLDQHHGYIEPSYSAYFTFASAPFKKGDYQINAVFNTLFPFYDAKRSYGLGREATSIGEIPAEHAFLFNLPYGNLFDVLTNDVSDEILQAYPVVIMAGIHGEWTGLTKKLVRYVKNGGTLVMDVTQIRKDMPHGFCSAQFSEELLSGKGYIGTSGKAVSENDFSFYKTEPAGAETIYRESETKLPLIIKNKYGRGRVIICTAPHFFDNKRGNLKVFAALLKRIISEIMPVQVMLVNGRIDFSLNKVDDYWLVTLINYDGVFHGMGQPVKIDKSKTAKLILTAEGNMKMVETIKEENVPSEYRSGKSMAEIEVLPGDIKIIKITKK